MPGKLADVFGVSPNYPAENTTLEGVFSNMATSIRACGYSGTITAIDMPAIVEDLWPSYNITWNLHNNLATAPAKTTFTKNDLPYTPPTLSSTTNNPWHNESSYNWTKNVKRVLTFSEWTPANIPVGTAEDVTFDASWSTKYTFSSPSNGGSQTSSMFLFNYIPAGDYTLSVTHLTFQHEKDSSNAQTACVVVRIIGNSSMTVTDITGPAASNYTVTSGTSPTNRNFTINGAGYFLAGWSFTKGQSTSSISFSLKNIPISISASSKIALGTFETPNDGKCTLLHGASNTTATLTKV